MTSEMGDTVINIVFCLHNSEANEGSVSKVAEHFPVALRAYVVVLPNEP